jgi:outer membrane lipoprotein SlyB
MAVVTRQLGSTRISPLVVAIAASAAIASLIGLGALTGVATNERSPLRDEVPLPRVEPKPGQQGACALCGTIESIRTVEVLDQVGATASTADSRNGAEAGAVGASAATSVLDTLSSVVTGNAAENNVRKRLVYRVTLRMDDGSFRAISLSSPPSFAVGDKVRVVEGRLVRA